MVVTGRVGAWLCGLRSNEDGPPRFSLVVGLLSSSSNGDGEGGGEVKVDSSILPPKHAQTTLDNVGAMPMVGLGPVAHHVPQNIMPPIRMFAASADR